MGRVRHLNCATMCPLAAQLVNGVGGFLQRGMMVAHVLLVETERAGLVLVDSGFGTGDVSDPGRYHAALRFVLGPRFDPAEPAIEQVRRLGHRPEDVRHLVVTHLDLDHAGGIPDFPWARVHLHAAEHRAAMARATLHERTRYVPAHWAHGPQWETYQDEGDDFFGLRAVRPLRGLEDAGVALVPTHGHTRGHSAVAVQEGDRWWLHAGDAYFHRGELERPASCPAGLAAFQRLVAIDDAARRANQSRLRDLHAAHRDEVTVFSAHDPVELERMQ